MATTKATTFLDSWPQTDKDQAVVRLCLKQKNKKQKQNNNNKKPFVFWGQFLLSQVKILND